MESRLYIEELEKKLVNNFDLCRDYKVNGEKYDLFAKYHLRSEKYFFSKSAKIYGMENNEYILIKTFTSFDKDDFDLYKNRIIKAIDKLVEAHVEHMSSIVTAVIVVEEGEEKITNDVIERISSFKHHKGFSFGFKGWVDIRMLLVSLNDGLITTNKKGKEVRDVYHITS